MNTNHQRIGIALDLLATGLFPFFEQSLRAVYGEKWEETARISCRSQASVQPGCFRWDAQAMLTVMWDTWNPVFRRSLGLIERSVVSELREFRNRWAHQTTMTEDDEYRVFDSVQRLLVACGAETSAAMIEEQKFDLLKEKLGRRVNEELARARFNRSRLIDVGLYAVCAAAIMTMMILMWGDRHPMSSGFVVGFTLFVFVYLICRRFQAAPPAYGVHECGQCRKVIYSENCPYCNPAPRPGTKTDRNATSKSAERGRGARPATLPVG